MLYSNVLHWKTAVLFFYGAGGIMLCYFLRNKFQEQVMQDSPFRVEEEYQLIEYQQAGEEEKVHLLVMLFLVLPTLTSLLRLFLLDQAQYPAIAWGYFAIICHLYFLVHHYREKLLLPLFRSKAVSLFVWLGGKLETEVYKERVGCVAITVSLLLALVLITIGVLPGTSRLLLFLMVGVYMCFKGIALTEASVYVEQVGSLKDLRSTIGQLYVDDRYFLPLFPMLFIAGVIAVALVGVCVAAPDLQNTYVFAKGCVVLKSLVVNGCAKVKSLIVASW